MVTFRYIKTLLLVFVCATVLTTSQICTDSVTAQPAVQETIATTTSTLTAPLAVVNNPTAYLNKTVTMEAKFDKFSTLGLDYKSAYKSSEEYISFLIQREDTQFNIPLSEMKLFLKRDVAEKFIDLKTDDVISITGTVFSDALGDTWIDVTDLKIVKKAPDKNGVK
jgi:hypothetical protein